MFCNRCGTANADSDQTCKSCGSGLSYPFTPSMRVRADQLPSALSSHLTAVQRDGLAFAARNMVVKSATIQSFNIGSQSKGSVQFAGLDRAFGNWGVFGGIGSITQNSVNMFRTDIQLKLEDTTGVRAFLNYSLPFPITLSIQQGEKLRVYFVKGGLPTPQKQGDFTLPAWTPFAAESLETAQLVPIAGLPTLASKEATGFLIGAIFSGLFFLFSAFNGAPGFAVFALALCAALIWGFVSRQNSNKRALGEATRGAAQATV